MASRESRPARDDSGRAWPSRPYTWLTTGQGVGINLRDGRGRANLRVVRRGGRYRGGEEKKRSNGHSSAGAGLWRGSPSSRHAIT